MYEQTDQGDDDEHDGRHRIDLVAHADRDGTELGPRNSARCRPAADYVDEHQDGQGQH